MAEDDATATTISIRFRLFSVQHLATPSLGALEIVVCCREGKARIELDSVRSGIAVVDSLHYAVEGELCLQVHVLHAGGVDVALANELARAIVAIEPPRIT